MQAIIKDGGKQNVDEIKVAENAEEMKAKDYTTALERMQSALKREKQMQLIKQMNEKNKTNVSYWCDSSGKLKLISSFNALQNGKRSVIGQLQSQVQRNDLNGSTDEQNVPESWKWENLDRIKDKRERKGKGKNKNRNKKKKQQQPANGPTSAEKN